MTGDQAGLPWIHPVVVEIAGISNEENRFPFTRLGA